MWLYNVSFFEIAFALSSAKEVAKIAFAPSLLFEGVPSNLISKLSISTWLAYLFNKYGLISLITLLTAFVTPFPKYLFKSLSLSSCAS